MMLSEMYLSSMLRNCTDEYEIRSKLTDAGVDFDDMSDVGGRMNLQCWNEKGALLSISFDNGSANVRKINL